MANKKEFLVKLIDYRTKINSINLSETAIENFVSTAHSLISYLNQMGGYHVAVDGLKQDIIMVDRNIKLGWKSGTQGERHFNNCKKDLLWTLGNVISGVEYAINKEGSE